jgi:hypothetical protein
MARWKRWRAMLRMVWFCSNFQLLTMLALGMRAVNIKKRWRIG